MSKTLETKVRLSGELDAALEKAIDGAKAQLDKMSEAAKKAASAYDKLGSTIGVQESTLKSLKRQYAAVCLEQGETSDEAKDLAKKIKNLSGELKDNKDKLSKAEKAADRFDDSLEDVGDSSKKAGDGFTVLKGSLAVLIADGFNKAISAAKDFAKSMISTSAEVKAENSQFSQTFGDFADQATAAIQRVAGNTGVIDTRLKQTGAQIFAFARSSGASVEEAMEIMEVALNSAADGAAYYDRSLEESAETLQSYLKGNFANDAALGLASTEFTRNAKAVELFGKKYNDLSEVQKQQTLLRMVTDSQELAGAMGQAAREADGWENVQGNLTETWRQFKAQVGTPFLETLIPIVQDLTARFTEWKDSVDWDAFSKKVKNAYESIKKFGKWIIDNSGTILAIIGGISAAMAVFKIANFISLIAKVIPVIKALGGVMTVLKFAIAALGGPVTLIIAGIAAVVTAFVILWNKCEWFRNFWINLWENIKNTFNAVVESLKEKFANFREGFSTFIESIKEKFANLKDGFANIIESIKEKFQVGFTALVGFVKAPINTIIGLVNKVIDRINEVSIDVPDWVPILGGKSFGVSIPNLPMLATGGFTSGPSIAGEAGREAVISFDPAYRSENLSYWAQAGQILGATVSSGAFLSAGSGGGTSIDLGGVNFAPHVTVQGNASKEDIIAAIQDQYPEFLDLLEQWMFERGEFVYG